MFSLSHGKQGACSRRSVPANARGGGLKLLEGPGRSARCPLPVERAAGNDQGHHTHSRTRTHSYTLMHTCTNMHDHVFMCVRVRPHEHAHTGLVHAGVPVCRLPAHGCHDGLRVGHSPGRIPRGHRHRAPCFISGAGPGQAAAPPNSTAAIITPWLRGLETETWRPGTARGQRRVTARPRACSNEPSLKAAFSTPEPCAPAPQ